MTSATSYDDPLELDDGLPDEPIREGYYVREPTGLSEEDDAARWLDRKFNPDMLFCVNCESYVILPASRDALCPRCTYYSLHPVGTPPLRRKYT